MTPIATRSLPKGYRGGTYPWGSKGVMSPRPLTLVPIKPISPKNCARKILKRPLESCFYCGFFAGLRFDVVQSWKNSLCEFLRSSLSCIKRVVVFVSQKQQKFKDKLVSSF